MYKFLTKNGQLLAFGLGVLVTILFLVIIFAGLGEYNMLSKEEQFQSSIFNFGLAASIALTVLAGVAAIAWGLFQMVTNPKGSLKGLIGIAGLVVVFLIFYAMATPETSGPVYKVLLDFGVTDTQSKLISGSLSTALILAIGAAVAFVVSEVINLFK